MQTVRLQDQAIETAGVESGAGVGTPSVPAVEKVFSILELIARSNAGMTLREISEVSRLPKSSVHGILVTLQRSGYLYRSARTSRYLFSGKLLSLTNDALNGLDLRDDAQSHLRLLARRTNMPVFLAIVDFHEAVVIAKLDYCVKSSPTRCWIGRRMELHCTGVGKALICGWPGDQLDRLMREHSLPRHNYNTIGNLTRLSKELAAIRTSGFAVDDEEDAIGYRSLGAPVHDAQSNVIAALGIAGSVAEITTENVAALAEELKATAREFSDSLSGSQVASAGE